MTGTDSSISTMGTRISSADFTLALRIPVNIPTITEKMMMSQILMNVINMA